MTKKSYAKVNIFLKIAGKRGNYHELVSRFVRVKNLFDEISFLPKESNQFTLLGSFGCELKKNTIYKAYVLLKEIDNNVELFFKKNCVLVNKNIPEFAGLGGGSSNAATFMLMVNEVCELNLSKDTLIEMGLTIGADVPFFLSEYESANVTGIGEKIEKFDEPALTIQTITPKVQCNTGAIFTQFREDYYKEIDNHEANKYLKTKSIDFLATHDIYEANDLYAPAVAQYKTLKEYQKEDWYFSGSGSSFFRVVKEDE